MLTENRNANAESEIRARIESWKQAFIAQDLNRIMSLYASDVVAFDAILALQFKGREAYRKHWEACMTMCSGHFQFDIHDFQVQAADDLAFGHYLVQCGGSNEKGEMQSGWMRVTLCLRRIDGQWQVVHEHYSVPFDPVSGKAMLDIQP